MAVKTENSKVISSHNKYQIYEEYSENKNN